MSAATNTRYSLRLRPRGGGGNDDGNHGAATATSRTALGNIANAQSEETAIPKKKTNVRRGRSRAAKTKVKAEEEDNGEEKPTRRSSSRRAAAVRQENKTDKGRKSAATDDDDDKKVAAKKKNGGAANNNTNAAANAKEEGPAVVPTKKKDAKIPRKMKKESTAAVVKKEPKAKKGGLKRSMRDGNSNDDGPNNTTATTKQQPSKRSKKTSDTIAHKGTTTAIVTAPRRTTRSRSRSSSARRGSTSKSNSNNKKVMRPFRAVEIVQPTTSIIPHDFGLKRDSFNGQNFTYGIAHYDAAKKSDPQLCSGLVTDLFQQLFHAETKYLIKPYLDDQADINAKMRAILIDWLVDVHTKFRLVPETLYLCVRLTDKYCSLADVPRSKLQLVGVTALLLACKHEEIYPPEVRDCVYITDRAYDRQEVLDMEQNILRVLGWKISLPTAYPFLDRFLSLTNASPMTRHTANYYMERTLQEHDCLDYRPSMVCASAVILALNNPEIEEYERDLPGLPKVLMEYTQFDEQELWKCMNLVSKKITAPIESSASKRKLDAVKKKYQSTKFFAVSTKKTVWDETVRYGMERSSGDLHGL